MGVNAIRNKDGSISIEIKKIIHNRDDIIKILKTILDENIIPIHIVVNNRSKVEQLLSYLESI